MLAISLLKRRAKLNRRKNRLLSSVYFSFFMLLCFLVVQQGWNLWLQFLNQKAATCITTTILVQQEVERLLDTLKEEEPATQRQIDYSYKISFFSNNLDRLSNLVEDVPAIQIQQIEKVKKSYKNWQALLSQKPIFYTNQSTVLEKAALDSVRNEVVILSEQYQQLLNSRRLHLLDLYRIHTNFNIASIILIFLLIIWNIYFLHQRVELPLRNLMKIGHRWQTGQLEAQLGYVSSDEIGRLTKILNSMTSKVSQRQQNLKARNQKLEDLIYALSHDLRTPLLATRNTLDCMLKGAFGLMSNSLREVLEEYRQTNEDLLNLVETLLDISRYETSNKNHHQLICNSLNWEHMFTKVINLIKSTSDKELTFIYKISPLLPNVYANTVEIQRVLQNLLDNAVRVSEENTEILLEVVNLGENQVKVAVHDQGPGITPLEKEKLFHRFIQGRGRRGKSGLGLYLCRQIVEMHGGMIGVDSILGEGSTFWFTLPVATEKSELPEQYQDISQHLQT
jgi:signal transduction histidine kinase